MQNRYQYWGIDPKKLDLESSTYNIFKNVIAKMRLKTPNNHLATAKRRN